jgi:hypothetical protein
MMRIKLPEEDALEAKRRKFLDYIKNNADSVLGVFLILNYLHETHIKEARGDKKHGFKNARTIAFNFLLHPRIRGLLRLNTAI